MPYPRLLFVASVAAIGVGCSETTYPIPSLPCEPVPAGPSLDDAQRDLLPPPPASRTVNEEWADLAREVPGGWGGMLLVEGRITIYLVDPAQRAQAVAALHDRGVGAPFYDIRNADVLCGRWDFAQLYDWRAYISVVVGWTDGMVSSDIDEGDNRLTYGVIDAQAADELRELLDQADIPSDLVVVEVTGPITLL